jgi:hypothetical protein
MGRGSDTCLTVWPKPPTANRSTFFRHGFSFNFELSTLNRHSFAWCAAQPVLFRFGIQINILQKLGALRVKHEGMVWRKVRKSKTPKPQLGARS